VALTACMLVCVCPAQFKYTRSLLGAHIASLLPPQHLQAAADAKPEERERGLSESAVAIEMQSAPWPEPALHAAAEPVAAASSEPVAAAAAQPQPAAAEPIADADHDPASPVSVPLMPPFTPPAGAAPLDAEGPSPRGGASQLLGVAVSDVMLSLAQEPEFALGTLAATQWLIKKTAYAPSPPNSVTSNGPRAVEAWAAGYDAALRSKV